MVDQPLAAEQIFFEIVCENAYIISGLKHPLFFLVCLMISYLGLFML